ncbi:MAG: MOSC N-terminal beta barrel domain-containing protein [Gloeobacterales cyanobacterium]
MPHLARIDIYPIKSLDGLTLPQATVLSSGALQHDREFALFDEQGKFVNGKHNKKVHAIRSYFDIHTQALSLQIEAQKQVFYIHEEHLKLETWFSDYFGFPVSLKQASQTGFPDDTYSLGPTVISTETLKEVNSWFPSLSLDEVRKRFRANLEIDGVPAFWEDQLVAEEGQVVPFQMGEVVFAGVNPCQRCPVPSRDSLTGEAYPDFQEIFVSKRKEKLPSWTLNARFNHFYKLGVNTRVLDKGSSSILNIGNQVKILEHPANTVGKQIDLKTHSADETY